MSEPALYVPPTRSRRGCFTCRRRKKKCDEKKPVCKGCTRNKLECRWPVEKPRKDQIDAHLISVANSSAEYQTLVPRSSRVTELEDEPSPSSINVDTSVCPLPESQLADVCQPELPPEEATMSPLFGDAIRNDSFSDASKSTTSDSTYHGLYDEVADSHEVLEDCDAEVVNTLTDDLDLYASTETAPIFSPQTWEAFMEPAITTEMVPASLSVLPQMSHDSSELLSFYLRVTANSMGNGSTDVNPFVVQLVPLAFQSDLVLRLILAQSAVHRQVYVSKDCQPSNELAERHYTDSLRLFRSLVGTYISGNDQSILPLAVGSLILSLTEVASGDVHGSTFQHIKAAASLLKKLLPQRCFGLSLDLQNFLVEYYSHMSALSIIGMAPQIRVSPSMDPEIEAMADAMVENKYVGQLCGCWLELLLVIPRIFALGKSLRDDGDDSAKAPSPDDISQYAFLQARILAWQPGINVSPETALAGLVFKQAVLLYLWSILASPHAVVADGNSMHHNLIEGAVSESLSLLEGFPATARVNTSLCWPLAIIGCCISQEEQRDMVRDRLRTMLNTMSLGNMRETLVLLEHVWSHPLDQISPWNLSQVMEEKQIWISFA